MDWISPKSPLKNGLFVRRPLSNAILLFLTKILRSKKRGGSIPANPKRILLCNIANFGDVVISTAVLPAIKKRFPHCEIGFMTSSMSAIVLKEHPLVARVHRFDHWYLHRHLGILKTLLSHWTSRKRLLQELKQVRYDIVIDLYSYFPNSIPLLAKSGIPVRIGYTTGGFSGLLTHPVTWNFYDRYVGCAHVHLLSLLGIDPSKTSPLPSYNYAKTKGDYIVVHMGSSQKLKEWEPEKWIALIRKLQANGEKVVLTGKGAREGDLCQFVAAQTAAKDLSNQLNWMEFVVTVQEARLLISVDSAAVHIAAAASTPTLGILSGINSFHMWTPPSPCYIGMMEQVPCAPCLNKDGCSTMACIKKIGVEESYRNILKLVGK